MKSVSEVIQMYRSDLEKKHAPVTVKNYISDIYHFINWFANYFGKPFYFDLLDIKVVLAYKKSRGGNKDNPDNALSKQSIDRHISSLRSFSAYLLDADVIHENPFAQDKGIQQDDPWRISEFKAYLINKQASDLTIKYYINDIQAFRVWAQEVIDAPLANTAQTAISSEIINEYKNRLLISAQLSPLSVNRKLSSIRNYASFLKTTLNDSVNNISKGINQDQNSFTLSDLTVPETNTEKNNSFFHIAKQPLSSYLKLEQKAADVISSKLVKNRITSSAHNKTVQGRLQEIDLVLQAYKNKNIKKEFYAPHTISLSGFPMHRKILHHLKHTRPNWYKNYHNYPLVHYFHFGILVIATVIAGIFVYDGTIGKVNAGSFYQKPSERTKVLTFKGRLLDKNNEPITSPTSIRFALYNSPTETTNSLLWEENQTNITPNENGYVNLIVGASKSIPSGLQNSDIPLYLGVTIGNGTELSPRKAIGTAFASNTEAVQGMLPITSSTETKNVLLALDSTGNLSIGGLANPIFQATGGDFKLSGQTLILASNPSTNGNVIISPDGSGAIEANAPLISNVTNERFNIDGLVAVEGGLGVHIASTTAAALYLNQDSRGPLLSGSTGGIAKFTVDNQGAITRGSWNADIIDTKYGGLGANISPASAGELIYSISGTRYATLRAGLEGQCLTAQGFKSPTWSACGGLTQMNGALFTANPYLDFLIGGSSTQSATFSFTHMKSGNPTFTIGNRIGLDMNGIQAYNNSNLTIGSSSTKNILLASSGNIGIGTTNPTRTLDVTGSFGGNVDLYIDGEGTRTIERNTPALVYNLEKNSGTTDASGVTTYNITGIPNNDGTIVYTYLKVSKGITPNPQQQSIILQVHGVTVATVSTPNQMLATNEIKHMTVIKSNGTWHIQGDSGTSNAADLAEWTPYEGDPPQPGDIVTITENGRIKKATTSYDKRLAGVIATKPAITIGLHTKESARLTLSGRIPTVVTDIGGEIVPGDGITSSIVPGGGMKPLKNGPIIGKALQGFPGSTPCTTVSSLEHVYWPEEDLQTITSSCFEIPVASLSQDIKTNLMTIYGLTNSDVIRIGKVMVLANLSWSNTDDLDVSMATILSSPTPLHTSSDPSLISLMEELQKKTHAAHVGGEIITTVKTYGKVAAGTIQAGLIQATDAVVEGTLVAYNIVGNSITTQEITSPIANLDTIKTSTIEPAAKDVNIKLASPSSELAIINGNDEVVSSIDNQGNISTEGSIAAQNVYADGSLTARSATFSGTLTANKIIADDIEGLQNQVSSFANKFLKDYEATANIPGYQLSESVLTASVSASFGTFHHGLISLGASTFGSLTAMDQISIGSDFIFSEGAVNTLGRTLEIQPLRQGAISLMNGAVTITQDGKLLVSEDATFAKNIYANQTLFAHIISPLPNQNLRFEIDDISNIQVTTASSGAVFSINNQGNVSASGSGTFSKLNFQLIADAIATSDLEAYATTSAGTATIQANRPELTIYNPLVTANSLIYITPTNNTDNQVLYLIRQIAENTTTPESEGAFTVGVSSIIPRNVSFNWLIVN